jgi:hypothetical protein
MPYLPLQPKQSTLYHSYLVRLWQDEQQMMWRAVVQSVQTGETHHFADLQSLCAFLLTQTSGNAEDNQSGQ